MTRRSQTRGCLPRLSATYLGSRILSLGHSRKASFVRSRWLTWKSATFESEVHAPTSTSWFVAELM